MTTTPIRISPSGAFEDVVTGTVDTVFGRYGNVLATFGDYQASQIANNSVVPGVSVADALNGVDADVVALQTWVAQRRSPVVNVGEPNDSGVVLLGDGSDETTNIATLFAWAKTLGTAVTLSFPTGTYNGFNDSEIPQFCSVEGNGSVFLRSTAVGVPLCGDVIRHESYLNIGQPSDSYVRDVTLKIAGVTDSMARRQSAFTHAVGAVVRASNWLPCMAGAPTLTFNAAARTISRNTGSWIFDEWMHLAATIDITGTVSNNMTGAAVLSVTDTVITMAVGVVLVNEVVAAGQTTGAYIAGASTIVTLIEPTLNCLKLLSQSGPTGTFMAIGELTCLEGSPGVILRGVAATDHQSKIKIIVGGAFGAMTFQYAPDGVTFGATQSTAAYVDETRGFEWPTGNGTLAVYFPRDQSSAYVAGAIIDPVPRIEVLGAPPTARTVVDCAISVAGALGVMRVQVGWAKFGLVDHFAAGRVTLAAAVVSAAGAPYWDYPIPGTGMTLRCHAGVYSTFGGAVSYTTPAQGYSVRAGTQIVDGGHVWEVQPAALCASFTAMGNIVHDMVKYDGGNCGPALNQAENVKLHSCQYRRAVGAEIFAANDGTLTIGAGGGYTNTVEVSGESVFTTGALAIVHDGGYTFRVGGNITFQRAARGVTYISQLNGGAIGPGIYSETEAFYTRTTRHFSGAWTTYSFKGLSFIGILNTGSGFNNAGNASGLFAAGNVWNGAVGMRGLSSIDDVNIDASNVHLTGGVIADSEGRSRAVTVRNGALKSTMPFADGKVEKTIANGANGTITWPGGIPYGIMGLGGPTALFTIAGLTLVEDGAKVRLEWSSGTVPGGFLSSGGNITTRDGKDLYLYPPAVGNRVAWVELQQMYSLWRVTGHSKAYNDGQVGSVVLANGVTAAISALMTSTSRITVLATVLSGGSAEQYIAHASDRVNGAPGTGSFKIRAIDFRVTALTLTFTIAGNTIARAAGDWVVDGLVNGDTIIVAGAVNAGNNTVYSVTLVTALVLTVTVVTQNEVATAGCTVARQRIDCNDTLTWSVREEG